MHNSNSGFGGNNYSGGSDSAAKAPYNAEGTKIIPKGVEELRDGLVKGLSKVAPKTEALSCVKAVDNVRYQLDLMLEVGQRNTKDGYITQAEYDTTAAKLRQAKSEIATALLATKRRFTSACRAEQPCQRVRGQVLVLNARDRLTSSCGGEWI